jgi:hypothetical protein
VSEHSVLAPSAAHRWSLCAGSLAACKHLPEDRSSEDAARGTVKHRMSELSLNRDGNAVDFLGNILEADGFSFTVDTEFVRQVQSYLDGIRRCIGRRYAEVKLDTSSVLGVPGQSGTADCVILNRKDKRLEVHDAKFGFHRVNAKGNKQGLIYIAAALEFYDIYDEWQTAKFVIHQPGIDHYDEETYTHAEVRAFLDEIRPQAARAWAMYQGTIPIELTPGPVQCEWCPIRTKCTARGEKILAMFPAGFQESEPEAPMLTDEEIGAAIPQLDEIESWCSDIRKEARTRALAGRKIPGQKLIKGKKGNRFWKDPKKAASNLSLVTDKEIYAPRELLSPTEVEKLVGKTEYEQLKSLVDQKDGALQLVPESDSHEEVRVSQLEFTTTGATENGLI